MGGWVGANHEFRGLVKLVDSVGSVGPAGPAGPGAQGRRGAGARGGRVGHVWGEGGPVRVLTRELQAGCGISCLTGYGLGFPKTEKPTKFKTKGRLVR